MAGNEEGGHITVSRDALRAELATLELRLIRQLATRADLEALETRVATFEIADPPGLREISITSQRNRQELDSLKAWRSYFTGAVAATGILSSTALGVALAYFF